MNEISRDWENFWKNWKENKKDQNKLKFVIQATETRFQNQHER